MVKESDKVRSNVQTPTVPALSLNGLLVSRGMNFSRVSRTTEWSTTGLPSGPAVTKLKGIVLITTTTLGKINKHRINLHSPDSLVILGKCRTRLEESVLPDVDASLGLSDSDDGETHLLDPGVHDLGDVNAGS